MDYVLSKFARVNGEKNVTGVQANSAETFILRGNLFGKNVSSGSVLEGKIWVLKEGEVLKKKQGFVAPVPTYQTYFGKHDPVPKDRRFIVILI